jgi:hypothetical protein
MQDALARGEAPTCPVTRHPVSPQVLAPNLAMHQAIAAWLAAGEGETRRRSPRMLTEQVAVVPTRRRSPLRVRKT